RKIQSGFVFVAVRGINSDGHDHIDMAVQNGAQALVVECADHIPENFKGAVLEVFDSKIILAELLKIFYERPEERMISIAVTGTNGKTSTSYMIESILNEASIPCGVIGTIDHHFQENRWVSDLTTPDTVTFYRRLDEFCRLGAKAFVMEVSSHSLKQRRVPILFDIAIFTNLSRDHLDYHKTMEDYWQSKQMLFTDHLKSSDDVFAILNNDDAHVKYTKTPKGVIRLTIGMQAADLLFQIKQTSLAGVEFSITHQNKIYSYKTMMTGLHNVYNWVGAIAAVLALGVSHSQIQRAVEKFPGVPGRLQKIPNRANKHVFVDYAHTPDALLKALTTLKEVTTGKLICVFGCGGDRDRGKRPEMAKVAAQVASTVIVTSDNPRTEDPQDIINQIIAGSEKSFLTEVDRAKAIEMACQLCTENDVVLIAGKGHEDYQIIGRDKLHFSDREEVLKFLGEQ
ncbi:MAG: UDP-N-acetylmuramoyl-L-alanyl-D-glutamate--2,6-diaminopimelate ligase, partial [Bdellovibrionales bacterium]|nr:UDP-N-acetylmuramoyl-L-alanyl-D-glutamate--2,6-diaminopimelate ligase [Bdellovibrionales bacterium]